MNRRFGTAWLLFAIAFALHVADEAAHDFLSVYNPNARILRERFGIPVPIFTFENWIISLCIAIAVLLALTPVAFRGARWLRVLAVPLAIIGGVMNTALHIGSSAYYRRFMPGVYSSPVLLAAAVFLLLQIPIPKPRSRSHMAGSH